MIGKFPLGKFPDVDIRCFSVFCISVLHLLLNLILYVREFLLNPVRISSFWNGIFCRFCCSNLPFTYLILRKMLKLTKIFALNFLSFYKGLNIMEFKTGLESTSLPTAQQLAHYSEKHLSAPTDSVYNSLFEIYVFILVFRNAGTSNR